MFKKLNSIRYSYIQAQLSTVFFVSITILIALTIVDITIDPDWLDQVNIVLFSFIHFLVGSLYAILIGFRSSGKLKSQIDDLSVMIMQLSRGNYSSRFRLEEPGEVSRIGTELNELAQKLDDQVHYLQRLADEKAAYAERAHKIATIEERQRLARDLHDSVSQQLFALTMMSKAVVRGIERHPEKVQQQVADLAETAMKAQTEMRALLLHLRPIHLSDQSLSDGIHNLIAELKTKSEIDFQVNIDQVNKLPRFTEEHIFRIIQEGLSNTLRHADATKVKIVLSHEPEHLFVHLADNGKGFDWTLADQKKTSYGLKTMRERSEEIGGQFNLRTKKGDGTYIDIRVPFPRQEADT
ncbi:histidine kinase [Amphibacillus sp. Q70]|uniref:sensor histidine kinase n=1 Tax=Amphibacillus sp. Q70 TaxID=3453416 RepID=UPI003F8664AE